MDECCLPVYRLPGIHNFLYGVKVEQCFYECCTYISVRRFRLSQLSAMTIEMWNFKCFFSTSDLRHIRGKPVSGAGKFCYVKMFTEKDE